MNSTSLISRGLVYALLCLAVPLSGQNKKQRDLKLEKDAPATAPGAPQAVKIPRSYALVVGVASYQNLPPTHQLQFPDRDAEADLLHPDQLGGRKFPRRKRT